MIDGTAAWQVLGIIGVILVILEPVIPGFILLPIGLGFLMTAGVGFWVNSWAVLLPVLATFEVLTFIWFRNMRQYQQKTNAYTNAEGMVGKECEVLETVTRGSSGYVRLYGDQWQAKTDCGSVLEKGSRALIAKIDGNKVWIEPISGKEE